MHYLVEEGNLDESVLSMVVEKVNIECRNFEHELELRRLEIEQEREKRTFERGKTRI